MEGRIKEEQRVMRRLEELAKAEGGRSKKEFPASIDAKTLLEMDIPDESAESAYRRGYRDAILKLTSAYDLLNIHQMAELFRWADNGELWEWVRKARDQDDPPAELPPDFIY